MSGRAQEKARPDERYRGVEMAGRRKKRRRSGAGLILLTLLILLIAAITGFYVRGMQQAEGKFLPNTTVNGMDYSGMTAAEAEEQFRSTYTGRQLEIREMDGISEIIRYDDLDYRFTTGSTFDELIDSQNYFMWPAAFFRPTEIVTKEGFEYDELKLRDAVHALNAVSGPQIQDPVNAHIERTDAGYVLMDAVDGNRLDEEMVQKLAAEAVNRGDSVMDLAELGCYKKASVYADDPDLQAQFELIDRYQNEVISISMEGNTYVPLAKDTFLDWMTFDRGKAAVSEEAVLAYTEQLAAQYNTFQKQRQFTTTNGDVVTVGGGDYDNYGYILNCAETAPVIRKALLSGQSQTIACVWDKYALTRDSSGSDFGNTYVEVSLDQQHLWYYKDGALVVDTPVVTGTANEKRATPTGVMQILDKRTNHKMKGSYGSSFAKFAMWLTNGGILIHDASWRDEYGGDIYLYDGSHGCVNTPLEAVKRIYDEIKIGTPVVIYDRENRVPHPHNETYSGETDPEDDGETDDPEEIAELLEDAELFSEEGLSGEDAENEAAGEDLFTGEDEGGGADEPVGEISDGGDEEIGFFDVEDEF